MGRYLLLLSLSFNVGGGGMVLMMREEMSSLLEMIWVCKFGCRPMLLETGPSCCCCVVLLFSSAMASQKALWVIKLSLLQCSILEHIYVHIVSYAMLNHAAL